MEQKYIFPDGLRYLGFVSRDEEIEEALKSLGLKDPKVNIYTSQREFYNADSQKYYYPRELKIEYNGLITYGGESRENYLLVLPKKEESLEPLQPEIIDCFSIIIGMSPTFRYYLPKKPNENEGLFPWFAEDTCKGCYDFWDIVPYDYDDLSNKRKKQLWDNFQKGRISTNIVYSFPAVYKSTERSLNRLLKNVQDQNLEIQIEKLEEKPLEKVMRIKRFFFAPPF